MSERIYKINDLIRTHLNDIILKDLSLKEGVFLTISKVDTANDLRYTRVFISIFPAKETSYGMKTLEKEIYNIQGKLNKKLHLKVLPKITFIADKTESTADEIEKLLQNLD